MFCEEFSYKIKMNRQENREWPNAKTIRSFNSNIKFYKNKSNII